MARTSRPGWLCLSWLGFALACGSPGMEPGTPRTGGGAGERGLVAATTTTSSDPGGQTGEEGAAHGKGSSIAPTCESVPLAPGEALPEGFSLTRLSALLDREYVTTVRWLAEGTLSRPRWGLVVSPPEGAGSETLTFVFRPGSTAHLLRSPAGAGLPCEGVVLGATLDIASGDTLLAAGIPTSVTFESPRVGGYQLEVAADQLTGLPVTVEGALSDGLWEVGAQLVVRGQLASSGTWGTASLRVQAVGAEPNTSVPAPENIELWRFPADQPCDDSFDLGIDLQTDFMGESGEDMLNTVAATPAIQVTWDTGMTRSVDIAFEPDAPVLCVAHEGVAMAEVAGTFTLTSGDASHMAAGRVIRYLDLTGAADLWLTPNAVAFDGGSFPAVLGAPEVDFGELVDRYLVFQVHYDPEGGPSGEVKVGGDAWVSGDCQTAEESPAGGDGGGEGAAAVTLCMWRQSHTLASATISAP